MPELTPTGAVDVVERQVRRVRRRKNLYELQRTLYLAITAAAVAAALLLPLALFAPADLFAIAAWSTLAVLVGLGLVLGGAIRRRWLARGRAVAWIESQQPLGGRVRTLLELGARPQASTAFFHALLTSQVGAGLEGWKPQHLVPRRVPRASFLAAVVALGALLVVFHFASLAMPAAPSIGGSGGPLIAERSERPASPGAGERSVVAPGVPGRSKDRPAPAADVGRRDDSTLTQLSSALQENVRQRVWGKAWERVRDALARAGTGTGTGAGRDEEGEEIDAEGSDEWEVANAPSGDPTRRRGPEGGQGTESSGDDADADASADAAKNEPNGDPSNAEGGAGTGAGNGTSPEDLFSGAAVDTAATQGSFELSLAARMRADRGGPGQPSGPAPASDPDAKPALAAEQRRETAAHRMAVPAAYEHVVREVFAHREAP